MGEWLGRREDGRPVWVEIRTSAVRDAAGRPVGFLGVAKDITERKRSRAELASGPGAARADRRHRAGLHRPVRRPAAGSPSSTSAYAARFGLTPEEVDRQTRSGRSWDEQGLRESRAPHGRGVAGRAGRVRDGDPLRDDRSPLHPLRLRAALGADGAVRGSSASSPTSASGSGRRPRCGRATRGWSWPAAPPGSRSGSGSPTPVSPPTRPEFCALYGLPARHPAAHLRGAGGRRVHPDDCDRVIEDLEAALAGEPALRHRVPRRLGRRQHPLDRGTGPDAARVEGAAGPDDRRQLRRHPPPRGGAPAPPARPAGDGRTARRRRGARGEQSDDGRLGRGRLHPPAGGPARRGAGRRRAHPAGGRAHRDHHPAAPRLQPAAGAPAAGARPQRGDPRVRGDHPPHRGRGHPARRGSSSRTWPGADRRGTAPAGAAQPQRSTRATRCRTAAR